MVLTAPLADEIRRLRGNQMSPVEIAEATGVSVRTVQAVLAGKATGRPLTPVQQFEEDARSGWAPLCLDPDEWADWRARVSFTGHHSEQAARPCDDCPLGFAADMRAEGRCNGTPGGVHDEPEEETPMDVVKMSGGQTRVEVAVVAPCGTCAHAAVCRLREHVESRSQLSAEAPVYDRAIRYELVATVTCEHYAKDRIRVASLTEVAAAPKRTGRPMSPEARANMAKAAQARVARERAAREAVEA